MYAVIFKAKVKHFDEAYAATAAKLRDLAFEKYRCIDFLAVCEGEQEVAISYWHNEDDIKAWKADPMHQEAQRLGRQSWYQNYSVEVVEVKRRYQHGV